MATAPNLPFYNAVVENSQQQPASPAPAPLGFPTWGTGTAGTTNTNTYDAAAAQQAQQTAAALAILNDQQRVINEQIGRLDPTLNVGLGNINNSYTNSLNRLDQQKAVANRDYDTGTQDTIKGYQSSRNQVATNVRGRENALQRLLGLAGSGNSSAAQDAVPYAATLEGTQQLAPVQQTYGINRRNLDTNWEDTLRNYQNSQQDLAAQKFQQEQSLRSSIAQTRADLLSKLSTLGVQRAQAQGGDVNAAIAAQGGTQAEINNLLNQIVNLGNQYANPVLRTADLAFQAPELGKYNLGPQGEIATSAPGSDNIDPTFLPVLNEKDKQQSLLSGLTG